jgi:hypothetical protein
MLGPVFCPVLEFVILVRDMIITEIMNSKTGHNTGPILEKLNEAQLMDQKQAIHK